MKPAAFVIVERNDKEILLVLRQDVPVWVLPGGGIEQHEDPLKAAQRETKEETCFQIKEPQLIATYIPQNALAAPISIFHAKVDQFRETKTSDPWSEVQAFRFFPIKQLPSNLFFLHRTILNEWTENGQHGIHRTLHEINYLMALKTCLCHPWYTVRYFLTRLFKL